MAQVEGIIFSDLFVNDKNTFIELFTSIYKEKQIQMDAAIAQLDHVLSTYTTKTITEAMASEFQIAWKNFQRTVLLNDNDLQIIVAYRGQGGRNAEFSQILKQEDIEGVGSTARGRQYGIMAGDNLVQDSIAAVKASKVEEALQVHLNGFLNQLEESITKGEARKIHLYHEYCLSNALQNTELPHITGMKWYQAFYTQSDSHYYSGRGLGQAYDAFMNHLANKETGIYDYLATNGLKGQTSIEKMMGGTRSVYVEEGGVEKSGNYPKLLRDSTNHTGWYTGGDIVIINPKTMQLVYNIQLKTTTRNNASVFGERVQKIREFLKGFMQLSPEQKGEKIFSFFLTSISNHGDFNNLPQEEINQLLKDTIMENISLKIF